MCKQRLSVPPDSWFLIAQMIKSGEITKILWSRKLRFSRQDSVMGIKIDVAWELISRYDNHDGGGNYLCQIGQN